MTVVTLVDVTDREGQLLQESWLERAEAVHRQLRPQVPADYVATMKRVFAGGGRMVVAAVGSAVCGVAVWRAYENTFLGRELYVDDLVTDEHQRSRGIGGRLLDHCEGIATELGCRAVRLDSGVQRSAAHRFYFRQGYVVAAFSFSKVLSEAKGRGMTGERLDPPRSPDRSETASRPASASGRPKRETNGDP